MAIETRPPAPPPGDMAQAGYQVRFDWGLRGAEALAVHCNAAVVVDVLSFSTCVDIACARGALVFPYPFKDATAAAFAAHRGAVLAASRSAGGWSLSPASLQSITPGTRLVLPSPNGATVAHACRAPLVLAGCLRNADAVAARAAQAGTVCVIAAAEQWPDGTPRFAFEDLVGAGAVVHALQGPKSPEARAAEAAYLSARSTLAAHLQACASGRELAARGFAADVDLAARLNTSGCVPVLQDGAFVDGCPRARPLL